MQERLNCAIYTRVSTDNQAEVEFNSCEAQEEKIKSFINSQESMSIHKIYSDPGYTGANLNRPGLRGILEDIKNGRINCVIAYKIDRLTRSPKDFYQLVELFDQHSVDFISVTERFDTSTPSGRLLRNIMLTFAQFERELASERTKDKMMQRIQKGMWNGGLVPFGYKSVDKKLVINEDEAKRVRAIYEDYLAGRPLANLAKEAKIYKS
ncbi:recombinase family protein, partial [Patescibacteria group bacterium]|nr:recombinase family protein [Patescibacteria group bacterium]